MGNFGGSSRTTAGIITGRTGEEKVAEERITVKDLSGLLELFRGRVYRASIQRAIEEVGGWRRKLDGTGDPDLAQIARNLGELEALLAADDLDVDAVGSLMSELGEQTVRVGGSGVPEAVDEKLQRLGGLLDADGRMLRILAGREDAPSGDERVSPERGSQ
jgi:hypothetical protein